MNSIDRPSAGPAAGLHRLSRDVESAPSKQAERTARPADADGFEQARASGLWQRASPGGARAQPPGDGIALQRSLQSTAESLRHQPLDKLRSAATEPLAMGPMMVDSTLRQAEARSGLQRSAAFADAGRVGPVDVQGHGNVKAGIAGVDAAGGASVRGGPMLETGGSMENGAGRLDVQGRGGVEARGGADGALSVDATGAHAAGNVGGEIFGGVEGSARQRGDWGEAGASGRANARAFAGADGNVDLDAQGVRGRLGGEAGAVVEAEGRADFRTRGTYLGGERLDLHGEVTGRAEAGARAEGTVNVDATLDPPRLGGEVGGKAFAGAKAEARATVGLGRFVSATGSAGAWAGAGAEGTGILGFDDGKLRFGLSGGAAVGYGAGAKGTVEVDVQAMGNAAIGTAMDFAAKAPSYAADPSALVFDASNLVFDVAGQGAQAATGVAKLATSAPQIVSQVVTGLSSPQTSTAQPSA